MLSTLMELAISARQAEARPEWRSIDSRRISPQYHCETSNLSTVPVWKVESLHKTSVKRRISPQYQCETSNLSTVPLGNIKFLHTSVKHQISPQYQCETIESLYSTGVKHRISPQYQCETSNPSTVPAWNIDSLHTTSVKRQISLPYQCETSNLSTGTVVWNTVVWNIESLLHRASVSGNSKDLNEAPVWNVEYLHSSIGKRWISSPPPPPSTHTQHVCPRSAKPEWARY